MSYAITAAYIVAALLFVVGIRRMRNPETARIGNLTSAIGMLIAVVATLFTPGMTDYLWIVVGIFAGSAVGYISAERVAMTAMPQLVAAFNGVGGGAAALVALSEFHRVHDLTHAPQLFVFTSAVLFSVLVGGVSFAGSGVAFAKLQGIWPRRLGSFPGQAYVNVLLFGGAVALGVVVLLGDAGTPMVAIVLGLAALLGILLVIPIGGADMPIVISLLNAFTGLAAAASGFALSNYVLINDDFADTDVVLVVGANDVVNPQAKEAGDTPISGMPVLDVGAARRVVFVKRSLAPGFAGIDNPLFYDEEKTMMLFSDARDGLEEMLEAVKKG